LRILLEPYREDSPPPHQIPISLRLEYHKHFGELQFPVEEAFCFRASALKRLVMASAVPFVGFAVVFGDDGSQSKGKRCVWLPLLPKYFPRIHIQQAFEGSGVPQAPFDSSLYSGLLPAL